MTVKQTFLLLIAFLFATSTNAQGVREHTRPTRQPGTTLTESQATDLTLTLGTAALRPIQTWLRTAGTIDGTGKILVASLSPAEAALVAVGQRVRAFPPTSKSSMYQARITGVSPGRGTVKVQATLIAPPRQNTMHYVMEIVVERGPFLSVPNEALIEEGDRHIVYVQQEPGHYVPQEIQTGIQGELYTQVLTGLSDGTPVVTIGSFFIDAEHKLKGTDEGPTTTDGHESH